VRGTLAQASPHDASGLRQSRTFIKVHLRIRKRRSVSGPDQERLTAQELNIEERVYAIVAGLLALFCGILMPRLLTVPIAISDQYCACRKLLRSPGSVPKLGGPVLSRECARPDRTNTNVHQPSLVYLVIPSALTLPLDLDLNARRVDN